MDISKMVFMQDPRPLSSELTVGMYVVSYITKHILILKLLYSSYSTKTEVLLIIYAYIALLLPLYNCLLYKNM